MPSDSIDQEFQFPASMKDWTPAVGLVLGSGLGSFVEVFENPQTASYAEIDGLPISAVPGHAGQFVYGDVAGIKVVVAQGRVHLYEGWSAAEVTAGVRAMAAMGISTIMLTNAAGCANPDFAVGDWMMLSDHLNLTGTTPLLGGPNFHDMTEVYSKELRAVFGHSAKSEGIALHSGVYAGLLGPQYETPAEVRMLRNLGADAVGMSTVLEAIQARALKLNVAGFSCLTNAAAGLGGEELDHTEVLDVGQQAAGKMIALLKRVFLQSDFMS